MGSKITLKNNTNTEFSIEHKDGSKAKTIASNDMVQAVDTITEMVALLNCEDGQVVIVREEGRGGTFVWSSTGTYNNGTVFAGTTGYWTRQYSGAMNVKWFGAKGDYNGVTGTDDYSAIQNCLTYVAQYNLLSLSGCEVFFPSGNYLMSNKALCYIGVSGSHDYGTPCIKITGEGSGNTYLVASSTNYNGLIELKTDGNSELFSIGDISFVSDLPAESLVNNGTAIKVWSTLSPASVGAFGSHPRRSCEIKDIYIGGFGTTVVDRANRGNFLNGIHLENLWFPTISKTFIRGGTSGWTLGVQDYALSGRDCAIKLVNSYSVEIGESYISGYYNYGISNNGIDYTSSGVTASYEDFRVYDSFIVGQNIGVHINHEQTYTAGALFEPGGSIINCHINSKQYGININKHRQVIISGAYFYVPKYSDYKETLVGLAASIYTNNVGEITINGCQFLEVGFYTDSNNSSCGILIDNIATNVAINSSIFSHGGICTRIKSTATGVVNLFGNTYLGQKTGDWATQIKLIDNAKIAGIIEQFIDIGALAHHVNIQSSLSSAGASIHQNAYTTRGDYATVSNPQLNQDTVYGLNSIGTSVLASAVRTDFTSNISGVEYSKINTFLINNGSTTQVSSAQIPTVSTDTSIALLINVAGALSLKTVKIGAADSGGAGYRILKVLN